MLELHHAKTWRDSAFRARSFVFFEPNREFAADRLVQHLPEPDADWPTCVGLTEATLSERAIGL